MIKLITTSLKRGHCGMALPMALVLLVVASFIVVPSLMAIQSLMTINSNVSKNTLAYYAADAGVADLVWKYKYGGTAPPPSYTLNNVNGMNVDVSLVKTSGEDYYWVSSAPSGTASKAQVYVHVQQTGSQGNNIFEQAAASLNGNIYMDGGASIISDNMSAGSSNYGNIYANGDVTVKSAHVGGTNCPAKGIASATGDVNIESGGCVGTFKEHQTPVSYALTISNFTGPADAGTNYTSMAANWGSGGSTYNNIGPGYVNGPVTIAGSNIIVLTGNLHVKGKLRITGGAQIKGAYTVISDGALTIDGGSTANLVAGNIPFFITTSTAADGKGKSAVNIGGSAEISAVIYAPNGTAYLSGGAGSDGYNVYGSVVAKSVYIHSMVVKYLTGVHSETQIPGAGLGGGSATLMGYDYQ